MLLQADCGLWSCPHCAAKLASRWTARAIHGAGELMLSNASMAMLTLTHRGKLTSDGSMRRWRECWPKLSSRARRANDGSWQYLYVHEKHKSGVLHTHFLTTDTLGERWWKDNPASTGFGYMNDWSELYSFVGAGAYVAKYLAKQLSDVVWPAGWRRIGTSRGWPKLPDVDAHEGFNWTVAKRAWEVRAELEAAIMQGYETTIHCNIKPLKEHLGDYCTRILMRYLDN